MTPAALDIEMDADAGACGYPRVPLHTVCEINPRRTPLLNRDDDAPTSFVPMPAVDAQSGTISDRLERPFREIRKGYTYFEDGDVIFAKITPCMQNGKHAICRDLINGFGFGSTEFHVLRPGPNLLAEWLHFYLRQPALLEDARRHFTGAVGQQRLPDDYLRELEIPVPPLHEQKRIATNLTSMLAAVENARLAAEERLAATEALSFAYVRDSLQNANPLKLYLGECLEEIKQGVGRSWDKYPVLGATRAGLAAAKEPVGKQPERYKFVDHGTVFYNPMRILLGSIAMVDDEHEPGITSPDYVVIRGKAGVLDARWFYRWFRSPFGEQLILSLSRGAVRERILFNRLSEGEIALPPYDVQRDASVKIAAAQRLIPQIVEEIELIKQLPAKLLSQVFGEGPQDNG